MLSAMTREGKAPFGRRGEHGLSLGGRAEVALVAALLFAACSDSGYAPVDADTVDGYEPPVDAGQVCQGNNDGVISRDELPVVMGASVDYLVNPPSTTVTVSPDGEQDGAGNVIWDFSSTEGQVFTVTLEPVWDKWFADYFPEADYASVTSPGDDTLGVYEVDDQAVWLLGYASPQEDHTLAIYDSPIALIRFPLSEGMSWVAVGEIQNGTWQGSPFATQDTFRVHVDQQGTLRLPYLDVKKTLRVGVEVVQSLPGGNTLRRIQYLYIHECYGELGRIVSQQGELDPRFTTAAEFRRLAL